MPNRITSRIVGTALIATVLITALVVAVNPQRAAAYTTRYYDGAGPDQPRIGIIGDSTIAAMRWYGRYDSLSSINYTYDAESCRRTTLPSCNGREDYTPENVLTTMRRLEGQLGEVLVLMNGYDDAGWQFGDAVDTIMEEAIAQGIPRVMWLTLRTADVDYVSPTFHSDRYTFRDNNRILLQKALKYGGRLQIADWATHSAEREDWVTWDGVHLTPSGADAAGHFIVRQARRVIAGRDVTPPRRLPQCRISINLLPGDGLEEVACLQKHLEVRGLTVERTGVVDAATAAAVDFINYARSWSQDGRADRNLLEAIDAWSEPSKVRPPCSSARELSQGQRGRDVRCLRRHLRSLGYRAGPNERRYTGELTVIVHHRRRAMGLPITGVADRQFLWRMRLWDPGCTVQVPLRWRDELDQVSCLERHLEGRGLRVASDARYGVDTARAVRAVERAEALPTDGRADSRLLRYLGAWAAPTNDRPACTVSAPLQPGQRGPAVGCLRRRLAAAGYSLAETPRSYGRFVVDAVRHWQRRKDLVADGIAGEVTLRSLGIWSAGT